MKSQKEVNEESEKVSRRVHEKSEEVRKSQKSR